MELTFVSPTVGKHVLSVTSQDSVSSLIDSYSKMIKVPPSFIRLIFAGKELKSSSSTLESVGIGSHNNFTVHAMVKVVDLVANSCGKSEPSSSKRKSPNQAVVSTVDLTSLDAPSLPISIPTSRRRKRTNQASTNSDVQVVDLTSSSDCVVLDDSVEVSRKKRSKPSKSFVLSVPSTSSDMVEELHHHGDDKEEKRAARFRKGSRADEDRIGRALTQRLYLLNQSDGSEEGKLGKNFSVLGSTGNVYEIHIGQLSSCTCPDYQNGNLCKHIIFVLVKVLRVPSSSYLIHQRAFLQSELKDMFTKATPSAASSVTADSTVLKAFREATGIESNVDSERDPTITNLTEELDGECPICFDEIRDTKEALDRCKVCRIVIHKDCISRRIRRGSDTCPQCRSVWNHSHSSREGEISHRISHGYINLSSPR